MQLFIQHVTELFASGVLFPDASAPVTQGNAPAEGDDLQDSLVRTTTPTPAFRENYPRTPQVAGIPGSAHLYRKPPPTSSFCMCRHHFGIPHPSEGWYVAYHAAVPGIYQGL